MSLLNKITEREVSHFLAQHPETKAIDMIIPDMCGILRGKRIGVEAADKLHDDGIRMPGSIYLLDSTGQNCETIDYGSRDGDPDYACFGDANTLKLVPWALTPTAQIIASMVDHQGNPYFADPRYILQRAWQPLKEMGLTPVVAIELEFYLLDGEIGAHGHPELARAPTTNLRQTTTQCYGIEELYEFEEFLNEVEEACVAQDVPADTATSEYGPGQYEINLHHEPDPLSACDNAIMLKRIIKGVARRHGFIASFMAKPFADLAGCGLHIHTSLIDKDGRNVFAGPTDPQSGLPISDMLRHAVGGLQATMPESMAVFAPNANSYRRFQVHSYAPVNKAWGVDNRSVSLRIPRADSRSIRIEHRVAGADANPYLVMAAVLAGIHHGLTQKLDPGPMEMGNAYLKNGDALPLRWWQSIDSFADGKVLPRYMGDHYCETYALARRFESDNFQSHITLRDYEWYMRSV